MLVAPRAVFASLRDESDDAVDARQEVLIAIVTLACIAGVMTTSVGRTLMNRQGVTPIIVAVWALFGGVAYALGLYWLGGGLLYGAAARFGGLGTYLRARSVVALASAPLALTLFTVWPLRIIIYGQNLFRTGGWDYGRGDRIFGGVMYAAFAWCAILLVIGVRSVHGWSWGRSLATVGLAAALPALIVFGTHYGHLSIFN